MNARLSPSSDTEQELADFVHGIERRGFALAVQQCTHAGTARACLVAGKALFHESAARADAARWTILYWRSLLAQPALRAHLARNRRQPLTLLDAGPRAALLLRYVAGLDDDDGANALDVSVEAYHHAVQRALRALSVEGIDDAWLRALAEPTPTPAHSAPPPAQPGTIPTRSRPERIPSWLRPALIGTLALLVLVGIGSYVWQPGFLRYGKLAPGAVESLPDHTAAEVLPATANLLASGDFAQWADPQGAAVARDLDFYSWYAATAGTPASSGNAGAALPESTAPETSAPDVDADTASGEADHAP